MSRRSRLIVPSQVHHTVQRGNNKQAIFLDNDDYLFYLKVLKEAIYKYQIAIHCYVLMPNHIHLLLTPQAETAPSQMMQFIGRFYVRYFNKKYNRTGTLWEGRFRSAVIDSERYLLDLYNYIESNPVRAKLVEKIDDYSFSSFKDNGLGVVDELITPHYHYLKLDDDEQKRQEAYQQIIDKGLDETVLEDIRLTLKKDKVLGDRAFIEKMEKMVRRKIITTNWGGDRRSSHYQETHKHTMRTKAHIYQELIYKEKALEKALQNPLHPNERRK
jgi:putative transposase